MPGIQSGGARNPDEGPLRGNAFVLIRERNPDGVKMAYTPDSIWRNRDQFLQGREAIRDFLAKKWEKENGYRLRKELFAFTENKVRPTNLNLIPPGDRFVPFLSRLAYLEVARELIAETLDCRAILVRVV